MAIVDKRLLTTNFSISANLLTWLTVHGNLCLALRHPQNRGASRPYVIGFTKELGKLLVRYGVMTEEQLKHAEREEAKEGSTDFL